jgi:hypothetical protein
MTEQVHIVRDDNGNPMVACNSPMTAAQWIKDEIRGHHPGARRYNQTKSLEWYLNEGLFQIDPPVDYIVMDIQPETIVQSAMDLMEQRIREGTASADEIVQFMRMTKDGE